MTAPRGGTARQRWFKSAALLVGIAVFSVRASAEPVVGHLSAPDLFELADRARAAGRNADASSIYDALMHDANGDVRAEARFRKGMMLAGARRFADAAVMFRALLDEKPDAAGARLELARMLAAMGDETAARREVRQVQASGLPEDVAITVDQFARALRSTRRFGGSLQVAIAPDSNVNRATQARTLDTVIAPLTLSDNARAHSGVGLQFGAQGFARVDLSDHLSVLPRLSGAGTFYQSGAYNDVSGSALIGLEWRRGHARFSPSIGQTWRWYGSAPYARTATASLDWLQPIGLRSQLSVHAGAARALYFRNTLQDGGLYDASASFEHALTKRSGFGVTVSGYRQTARDPGYATVSLGTSAVAWRDLGKVTLVASSGLYRLEGDERLFLFADRRREWLLKGSLAGTFRQLKVASFAPSFRVILEQNKSTVALYDYRRTAVEFGINRAF